MLQVVDSMGLAKRPFSKHCSSTVSCANDPQRTLFSSEIENEMVVAGPNLEN